MGLDITYGRRAVLVPDADTDNYANGEYRAYANPDFAGRANGIADGVYRLEDVDGFRAGSYGGYNRWRSQLCQLAHKCEPSVIWARRPFEGVFAELIDFSDCEGVISPETCAKLARDFAEWDDRAKAMPDVDGYFYEKYQAWRKAFEVAADGGFVMFH